MSNGIYDILGKLASLTPKEETAKTEPQKIYESVEAKGSILEGVSAIEAKLQKEFVAEKAVSKAQQKFMGMVHATQKGEKAPSKEVAKVAKSMGKKDAKDFASTKHKGLPQHVSEEPAEPCATKHELLNKMTSLVKATALKNGIEIEASDCQTLAQYLGSLAVSGKSERVIKAELNSILRGSFQEGAEPCAECGLAEAECTCVHEGEITHTASGGIRHKGTYGTEYQGDPDEDDEEQHKIDTGIRGRGRPRKHAKKEKVAGRGRGRPKADKPPFSGKNAAGALTNILFGKAPKLPGKGRVHRMDEGRMLDEAGEALEHILNRFKAEVKSFEQGNDLDQDLYDALYDYYCDMAEMPYGVQKARTGDPYNWVTNKLDDYLVSQGVDKWEGVEETAGGMGAASVAVAPERSLEEEIAELTELAKLAGIETEGNAFGSAVRKAKADGIQPGEKVEVGGEEYPVKEDEVEVDQSAEKLANSPDEEYISMRASTLNPGEGDAGEKQMNPDRPTFKNGDNALSKPPVRAKEPTLEARLAAEYESIKKVSK